MKPTSYGAPGNQQRSPNPQQDLQPLLQRGGANTPYDPARNIYQPGAYVPTRPVSRYYDPVRGRFTRRRVTRHPLGAYGLAFCLGALLAFMLMSLLAPVVPS